ncbi:MAG TPA: DUF4091 domain-containing protein [Phycisphaerae bacterium]|nr:DUF4091 domain-containing protein [Phycisphaerae bacterium]
MNRTLCCAVWLAAVLAFIGLATSADAEIASQRSQAAGLQSWAELSTCKIFRDHLPPADAPRELRICAARNEWESAQWVLRPDRPVTLVSADVTVPTRSDGRRLAPGSVGLLEVRYVHLPNYKKDYPDPLPPLKLPLSLAAGQTQPIWIRVRIAADTEPGDYHGGLQLRFDDGSAEAVPLTVTVWPLTLPAKPSMRTAFGIWDKWIAVHHEVSPGSAEHRRLVVAYYEELLEHRISAYSPPVSVLDPAAGRYLSDERVTSFTVPYSDDEAKLRRTIEHIRQNGWQDKGYFYVVDEPKDEEQYRRLTEVCRKIHAIDPSLKIVAPFYCDSEFGEKKTPYELLRGLINIWCPNTGYFKPEPLIERQQAGDEAWWYVCCGPGEPHANFFIEMAGMSHRMLMWQQKKYGVEGLLYWGTTAWNTSSTTDPWEDMATVKDINPYIHGDGALFYPGKKVGVDGPVTSVRLEIIRDGLEDYEYLTLYEKQFGPARTQELISRVVKSLTEFERDPAVLDRLRQEMARMLMSK